jgi:ABC-type oligopeptide transport system substrate-binding subunit
MRRRSEGAVRSALQRGYKLFALLGIFSLIAVSCGDDSDDDTEAADESEAANAPEGDDAVEGGEVVDLSAFAGDPPSHIDPLLSTTVGATQVNGSVYDGLTEVDYSNPAEPVARGLAAESWEADDESLVWTFQIRDGLTFSNGDPVLPSSFKRGWELMAAYGGNYSYVQGFVDGGQAVLDGDETEISGIEADDDEMTLTVTLADPFAGFEFMISHHSFSPMPEEREMPGGDVDPDAQSDWEAPDGGGMIGNGPFVLESWADDYSEVVMVPNPEWDGTAYDEELELPEQPYLDKVTFVASDEIDTAFNDFEAGGGDIAAIPEGQVDYATENYQTLIDEPALGAYYFQMNGEEGPLAGEENYLLRRAIMQAIDREDINDVVYNGSRVSASGITPEGIPGWEAGVCDYCEYNPEGAEEDFQAWEDEGNSLDEPIPIQFNAGFGHESVVSIMVENLDAVGIDAVDDPRDADTYFDDLANGECVLCRAGWLADYPLYLNFMTDLFHSKSFGENNYGFVNDEFDALVDEAQVEPDAEAGYEKYREAESLLLNDNAGVLPLNWYRSTTVYNPDTISYLYEDPSFHIHWETVQVAE